MALHRDQPRRGSRAARPYARRNPRRRPRPAYFFAPPLAPFAAFLISSISSPRRRPIALAAALPARFTARPPRLPLSPLLDTPSSASAPRAAVAATATNSATSGL